jgi:cyclophilin family peptidyl-prolyl cis-trans isomerase
MDLHRAENVERSEDSTKLSTPNYAVMDTAKGSITIEIYKDASAGVVDRFVKLCKSDYFKGMPFRHVIKNFVIQGGDFDFNGASQDWILKAKASGENALSPKHEAFMIGTTKSPNNKGFDIFITTAPIPDLNDKIVVFGRVIKGEDIVQEIEEIDTDDHYQPKTPIGIINITLRQEL